jgi:hypothetical protein
VSDMVYLLDTQGRNMEIQEVITESLGQRKHSILQMPMQSDDLKDLFTALAKAQGEMRVAGNRSENPFFKSRYADLAEVVNASRPSLSKFGLSVMQRVLPNDDGQNLIHTILGHSSGQFITSLMRVLPIKNDMQSLGSCLTYLKRYAYAALVGVVTSDEDDDGERVMVESREVSTKGTSLNTKYSPKEQTGDTITREQLEELNYELGEYPDIAEQVLDGLRIHVLADMPKGKFLASINRIRSIKAARNGK